MRPSIRLGLLLLSGVMAGSLLGYIGYQVGHALVKPPWHTTLDVLSSAAVGRPDSPSPSALSPTPLGPTALVPRPALPQSSVAESPVATIFPATPAASSAPAAPPLQVIKPPTSSREPRDAPLAPAVGEQALVFGDWEKGGWTDVLVQPEAGAERLSQALLGDRVQVLAQQPGWSRVAIAVQGGIQGWVKTTHLTRGSPRVRQSLTWDKLYLVVRVPGVAVDGATFVPFGARLPATTTAGQELRLSLPDGRQVGVPAADVRALEQPLSLAEAIERIKGFRQVPYQSGANTRMAMDGAGLIYLLFRVTGAIIPRTLEGLQQAGVAVSSQQRQVGDIVFFSTFHAGQLRPVIILDDQIFIEASPAQGVGLGWFEQMQNHKILEVRRYAARPSALAPDCNKSTDGTAWTSFRSTGVNR